VWPIISIWPNNKRSAIQCISIVGLFVLVCTLIGVDILYQTLSLNPNKWLTQFGYFGILFYM